MNPGKFLAELKRRNVYKVAVAYAVVAWLLIQVATQVFPFFEIPNWAIRLIVLAIVIGFPISLVIAWAFELTPQGIKRTEDSDVAAASHTKSFAWIYVVVVGALLSLSLFLLGRYGFRETNSSSTNSPAKSIAVLPFDNLSRDPDNAYFAEGVQDEILARLSKIAELKVISRTSTMFDRAFAISPDETDFIGERAETLFAEGDLDAAEKLLRDPTLRGAGEATGAYVNCLFYRRQFNEAAQTLTKTIEGKKFSGLRQADDKSWLGTLKVMAGHEEEGRVLLEEARRELIALRNSGNTGTRLRDALLFANAALLDRPEVERGAAELLNETKQDLWLAPSSEEGIAACFAYLGDADRAIPLLQHALSVSYYRAVTPALLRLDPIWDKIRNDPRFQTLAAGKL